MRNKLTKIAMAAGFGLATGTRFLSTAALIAILLFASSANAQLEQLVIASFKWFWNENAKSNKIRDQLKEIQPNYEGWIQSLEDYISETGKVGDCKTIGFRQLSENSGQSTNFFYECGTNDDGNIAFLEVKNKIEIGSCGKGNSFRVEFDIRKNKLEVLSLDPVCVFFQPSCRALIKGFCPTDDIKMEFARGGTFNNTMVNSFCIGKYEVTQREWKEIMGGNPSEFKNCDRCPVEMVSMNDVQRFINNLNAKTGMNYRLPTSAEWEYAADGGCQCTETQCSGNWGDRNFSDIAWYNSNSNGHTQPVGTTKQPNTLGIYDMRGNVWEWVADSKVYAYGWAWSTTYNYSSKYINNPPPKLDTHRNDLGFRLVHPPVDKAFMQKDCQDKGKVWDKDKCRVRTPTEIEADKKACQANGKVWEDKVFSHTCREKTTADVEAEKRNCQAGGKVWENNACREKTPAEIDTGKSTCQAGGKVWENNVCREKTSAELKAANQDELIKAGAKLFQQLFKK